MTRKTTQAAGIVVAGALILLLIPASASARKTTGYEVYNFTSSALRLASIIAEPGFDDSDSAPVAPEVDDLLQPGFDRESDHNHIEIKYRTLYQNFAILQYTGPRGKATVYLRDSECGDCRYRPIAECSAASTKGYQCESDGATVTILDPPGTTHEVTGEAVQKQAQVLRELCTRMNVDKKAVGCKFKPTHRDLEAFGNPHLVGGVVPNCTEREVINKVESRDKEVLVNSWGVKVGTEISEGAIFESAKESIEIEYGGETKEEHEFSHALDVPIPPGYIGWIEGVNPVVRYTGDYTLTIGNTTWKLRGVYFDYPDPSREGHENWRPREAKMTPAQFKAECSGRPPRREFALPAASQGDLPQRAPASWATITQRGTNRTEALVGGRESTTLIARGGNDILRGGSGDDNLIGGPGNDAFHGGPGADTIVDHRGRSRVWTGASGPLGRDVVDVRDGEGNDKVTCGDGKATVKADPGDRVRRCGS